MAPIETPARLRIRLVGSGPAGGAILAARLAAETGHDAVCRMIRGTTAKPCLIDNQHPQTAHKFEIARAESFVKGSGMAVRIPVIETIEIGAGAPEAYLIYERAAFMRYKGQGHKIENCHR